MKISTQIAAFPLGKKYLGLSVISFLFLNISQKGFAQTRAFVNPGLEFGVANGVVQQTDTNFGFGPTFDAGLPVTAPWYTSHPAQANSCTVGVVGACHPIEVWGNGAVGGVQAAQGTNLVELNAYVSSMIYQNLYLANGDIITYNFKHRARSVDTERAAMVIEDQSEANVATIHSTTLPSSTTSWLTNAGTYTFTGTSGVYRVGFRAISSPNPGAGNLLDDIRVTLNPLVDLKFSNALSSCEGASNGSLFMRVNGAVTTATTVAFELINPNNSTAVASDNDIVLTAVANSNGTPVITHTPGTNIYLVSIPVGNYDGGATPGYSSPNNDEDGIRINISSVNDTVYEPNETFKFEIKQQNTNGSSNNFVSTSSPIYGDTYYPTTNDYFIQRCVCYDDANTSTAGTNTTVGISLLQKVTPNNGNWPASRKSGHLALESNNKGFVVSRLTTAQITSLVSPQEGMMVYDTVVKCLKIYDGTAWSCFSTPACP